MTTYSQAAQVIAPTSTYSLQAQVTYETWLAALASSACIGFTSLVPWLFNMTFFERRRQQQTGKNSNHEDYRMKFLLSFAVGAILGDIFLHLIPESFHSHIVELNDSPETAHKKVGVSIIGGIFMFIIVEMVLEKWSRPPDSSQEGDSNASSTYERTDAELSAIKKQRLDIQHKQDLKQTIGALINYFEQNGNFESNNNNLIKNLNYQINNDEQIEGLAVHLKRPKVIESINNNNYESTKIDQSTHDDQLLRCRSGGEAKQLSSTKCVDSNQMIGKNEETDIKGRNFDKDHWQDGEVDEYFAKSIETVGGEKKRDDKSVEVAGYLSLIANGFDNFTHGLAIGASFLVGPKVGLLTTFVIFIHEIPHEICDYAILVNSGFSRWEAVKAQSSVSLFGILGTVTALYVKSIETLTAQTCWILPFSAGGFLYIALVNLLPEILDHKTSFKNSSGQIICVTLGIAFMAIVGVI